MTTRRGFLKILGIGGAAAAAKPVLGEAQEPRTPMLVVRAVDSVTGDPIPRVNVYAQYADLYDAGTRQPGIVQARTDDDGYVRAPLCQEARDIRTHVRKWDKDGKYNSWSRVARSSPTEGLELVAALNDEFALFGRTMAKGWAKAMDDIEVE